MLGTSGYGWNTWASINYQQVDFGDLMESSLNFKNSRKVTAICSAKNYTNKYNLTKTLTDTSETIKLFNVYGATNPYYALIGRIYMSQISQGTELVRDFVPAIDANGTPCMYDKITKTPFYNIGTGEFGYGSVVETVTASKVYARLVNGELEVVAENAVSEESVMTLDNNSTAYVLFNNVGEAMEYFNIKSEETESL